MDVLAEGVLGLVVTVDLFLREMPETMVRVGPYGHKSVWEAKIGEFLVVMVHQCLTRS